MSLAASVFTDPAARAGLQAYYDQLKADTVASLRAREADPSFQATFDAKVMMPDGTQQTVTGHLITADMAEKSFVSFDKWVGFMADAYAVEEHSMATAQQRLEDVQAQGPETSSGVRATFAAHGQLLAYINADGSLVTSNGADRLLRGIAEKAHAQGLKGEGLIAYVSREVGKVLADKVGDVRVTSYREEDSPTKAAFGKMWYTHFDVNQMYRDALADAQASYDSAKAWHDQWQQNISKMQAFLLGYQEVA